MNPITFVQGDKYFDGAGPVEVTLRDPAATYYTQPPAGHVFDPSYPEQDFAYPAGTGVLKRLQFVEVDGEPELALYIIVNPSRLNMVTNPNKETAASKMPTPLIPLSGKQGIVKVRVQAGILLVDEWWLIQDTSVTPPTGPSTGGVVDYTEADRQRDIDTHLVVSKIAQSLGVK